jgi:hypothetical protein
MTREDFRKVLQTAGFTEVNGFDYEAWKLRGHKVEFWVRFDYEDNSDYSYCVTDQQVDLGQFLRSFISQVDNTVEELDYDDRYAEVREFRNKLSTY